MWVLVVSAAVDGLAVYGEQDVALFDAGSLGSTALADGLNVNSALIVGKFQPLPERRVFCAGDGNPKTGESLIVVVGAFLEEAGDDVGGGYVADLVLGVIADEDARELSFVDDGQRVTAGGTLHGGLDEVGEEAVAGEEIGGDVGAL